MSMNFTSNDSITLPRRLAEEIAPPPRESAVTESSVQTSRKTSGDPSHLKHLEGLRGLAALWVALQHIFRHTLVTAPMTGWRADLRDGLEWIFQGRVAVNIFIVLSGYLLMRPVLRAKTGNMPGGTLAYLVRRSRRILPPYYAALAMSIMLILAIPALGRAISVEWGDALPAFGHGSVLAHLVMGHNLSRFWASKIDPPMWTVATEWQIYFLFPLLLLPAWRRLGNWGSIAVGLGLGLGLFLITGKGHATAPWFLGLFAFGMAAATRDRAGAGSDDRKIFGWLAVLLFGAFALITGLCQMGSLRFLTTSGVEGLWPYNWEFDLLAGVASACLLVFCRGGVAQNPHRVVRFLSSKTLVRIGVFSYSLYLIHDPLMAIEKLWLDHAGLAPYSQFSAMILLGLPPIFLATYIFHLIFEKPFMSSGRTRREPIAAVIPAQTGEKLAEVEG